ncbi:MAG: universal stress protein [Acidimicrobiia bacterium]|nr:universal stress protein [Acidimicrobiia bacterium]
MKRIVVGADGSPGAAYAMRWAASIAAAMEVEVVAMTGSPGQEQDLLRWWEAARVGELDVRCVVEEGDPRPGILRVAEREEADLVVVGRYGISSGPGLLHLGSMAEWLAHHAELPLAVVGGVVNLPMHGALVGVDGSAGSRAAVGWVRDVAAGVPIRIVAASVQQPIVEWTPASSPENWRRGVERRIVEDFAAELTGAGLEFAPTALRGTSVADTLVEAARHERADLIVVGARGLGGFSGLRIGGIALKALHAADRPIVLVPSG